MPRVARAISVLAGFGLQLSDETALLLFLALRAHVPETLRVPYLFFAARVMAASHPFSHAHASAPRQVHTCLDQSTCYHLGR